MGRRSTIEAAGAGALVSAMRRAGAPLEEIASRVSAAIGGASVSRDAVRRWLDSEAGRRAMSSIESTTATTVRVGDQGFVADLREVVQLLKLIGSDVMVDARWRVRALEAAGQSCYLGAQLEEISTLTSVTAKAER